MRAPSMLRCPRFAAWSRTIACAAMLANFVIFAFCALGPAVAWAGPFQLPFGQPTVELSPIHVLEGNNGWRSAQFTIRLSASPEMPVVLTYRTEDRSATAGEDYLALAGEIAFDQGQLAQSVIVTVLGDTILEPNETFALRIETASGAELPDSVAACMIANDERTTFELATDFQFTRFLGGTLSSAWGDCDRDGDPDLSIFNNVAPTGFTENPTIRAAVAGGNYHGVAWCDYDQDGDGDLVLLPYDLGAEIESPSAAPPPGERALGTPPTLHLLRNDHETFTDVAPELGMNVAGNGETAVWADFDGDGWPDLFAPFYSHVPPYQSFLFHNLGNGSFESVGVAAGVSLSGQPASRKPEGAHAVDWNDDGHVDLYCASHLFVNDGSGTFTDVRAAVGLPEVFDEGSFFLDYDRDGDFDLFLRTFAGVRLFRDDAGHFVETTAGSGVVAGDLAWGDNAADVDNDGDVDLLLAGHYGQARLFLNQGDGTFVADAQLGAIESSKEQFALADFDGDGDLDLAYDGLYGRRVLRNRLERMAGAWGSSLRLRVLDAQGHENAFGGTVRLRGPFADVEGVQTRAIDGGSGYLTQNDYVVHFGGVGSGPLSLEVVYPRPAGERLVVNSAINPALGAFVPDPKRFAPRYRLFADGRLEPDDGLTIGVPGVPGVPEPPSSRAGSVARIARILPSPASSPARVEFALDRGADVEVWVHDVRGRCVRRLEAGPLPAGAHVMSWDLKDERGGAVPPGVYVCRLVANGQVVDARRLPVVR